MGSLAAFYAVARAEYGLGDGQSYRSSSWGMQPSSRSQFARWSPAETAIIYFYLAAGPRLLNPVTGMPFRDAQAFIGMARMALGFNRSVVQWYRKTKRLVSLTRPQLIISNH